MFLTFKNSPKLKKPSQTHLETHNMAYEPIKARENTIAPIKTHKKST